MPKFVSTDELPALVGTCVGETEWLKISSYRINQFAASTNSQEDSYLGRSDSAKSFYGSTKAHECLSLSLIGFFADQAGIVPRGAQCARSYGMKEVRFLNPVYAGQNIRGRFVLRSAEETTPNQWLTSTDVTIEIKGEPEPALTAVIQTLFTTAPN